MMEKLGQAKTHLELKKMIAEVDTTNSGNWYYFNIIIIKNYCLQEQLVIMSSLL